MRGLVSDVFAFCSLQLDRFCFRWQNKWIFLSTPHVCYVYDGYAYSAWECFVAARASLTQIGSEFLKESYWRAAVGAPETDFLLPPFLNPGACCDALEETPLS